MRYSPILVPSVSFLSSHRPYLLGLYADRGLYGMPLETKKWRDLLSAFLGLFGFGEQKIFWDRTPLITVIGLRTVFIFLPFFLIRHRNVRLLLIFTGLGSTFSHVRTARPILFGIIKFYLNVFLTLKKNALVIGFQNYSDPLDLLIFPYIFRSNMHYLGPSGVPLPVISGNFKATSPPYTVILPSRLLRDKGIADFCIVAEILHANNPGWHNLVVAGAVDPSNPCSYTQSEIDLLSSRFPVKFIGQVNDMDALYRHAHLVLFPSHREGFPRTLCEAFSFGLPCIGYAVPGVDESIEHGFTGFLAHLGDTTSLAGYVHRITSDSKLYREMSINCLLKASQFYSRETAAKRLQRVLEYAL